MVKPRGKCPVSHIAIDTETTGLDFKRGVRPYAVSLCTDRGDTYYFPWKVNPRTREVTVKPADVKEIKRLLKAHDKIVMHNALFDVAALLTIGIDLRDRWDDIEDTMFASHALDSREDHGLKPLAKKYHGIPDDDQKALQVLTNKARNLARKRNEEAGEELYKLADATAADFWLTALFFPKEKALEEYATIDAERTLLLWLKTFAPQLVKDGLWDQYKKHMRIIPPIFAMQDRGLTIHKNKLSTELKRVLKLRDDALREAIKIIPKKNCPKPLNLNSRDQLAVVLHECFDLPILYRTETGKPATDAATLKELEQHAKRKSSAAKFLHHKLYSDQAGTTAKYLVNYTEHLITHNGVAYLFPSINPTGTGTLRVSGSNPNPQNVGKGKEQELDDGTKIIDFKLRSVFGPQHGRIWYALDYDQLQLRIFAKASGEKRMMKAFDDGYDFHTWMGCEIFQVAPDQLTKLQRRVAKNVNFGYIFGAGPKKIEATAGMPGLSTKLAKMFPIVDDFMKETIDFVRRYGYVFTLGGYRLAVEKAKAYSGVCIIVQGTEGEIVKEAMVRVYNRITPFGDDFYNTLQVHDELIFDASKKSKCDHTTVLRGIKQDMEDAGMSVGVRTIANCEVIRQNWATAEKLAL